MVKIEITQLDKKDEKALFDFEVENKAFFERFVPPRKNDYYLYESFQYYHQALIEEMENKIGHYYLIKETVENTIIGRINLVYIDQFTCELGYRIKESYTNKGIGKIAVLKIIEIAKTLKIKKLIAKTTDHNIGSQKVLESCCFKTVDLIEPAFEFNDQRVHFINYEYDILC